MYVYAFQSTYLTYILEYNVPLNALIMATFIKLNCFSIIKIIHIYRS